MKHTLSYNIPGRKGKDACEKRDVKADEKIQQILFLSEGLVRIIEKRYPEESERLYKKYLVKRDSADQSE